MKYVYEKVIMMLSSHYIYHVYNYNQVLQDVCFVNNNRPYVAYKLDNKKAIIHSLFPPLCVYHQIALNLAADYITNCHVGNLWKLWKDAIYTSLFIQSVQDLSRIGMAKLQCFTFYKKH